VAENSSSLPSIARAGTPTTGPRGAQEADGENNRRVQSGVKREEWGGGEATDARSARPERGRAGGGSQACKEGWKGEMEMPARKIATGACRSHPVGEDGRVGWQTRAMRAERVVGGMEEGARWPCSRAWWVGENRRRRDGRDDGGEKGWASRAIP